VPGGGDRARWDDRLVVGDFLAESGGEGVATQLPEKIPVPKREYRCARAGHSRIHAIRMTHPPASGTSGRSPRGPSLPMPAPDVNLGPKSRSSGGCRFKGL
jgi:hypothetical protein